MKVSRLTNVAIKRLEKNKVDYDAEYSIPEVILGIREGDEEIPVFTNGNFSVITGKPKSRKSTFLTALSAAFLKGNEGEYNMYSDIENGKILWVDTEQGMYHLHKNIKRIFEVVPESKKRVDTYSFRPMDPSDRYTNFKHLVEYYVSQGTQLIVLDGVADLLEEGYNDEKNAKKIESYLLKITGELNCHIVTVIHENKANAMAKGHIGSYLNQKAESVLRVVKDQNNPDFSTISAHFTRNRDFKSFEFYTENDLPIIKTIAHNVTSKGRIDFMSIAKEDQVAFLLKVKSKEELEWMLRKDLITILKEPNEVLPSGCSENMAKKWLAHLVELDLLIQDKSKQNSPYKINL